MELVLQCHFVQYESDIGWCHESDKVLLTCRIEWETVKDHNVMLGPLIVGILEETKGFKE